MSLEEASAFCITKKKPTTTTDMTCSGSSSPQQSEATAKTKVAAAADAVNEVKVAKWDLRALRDLKEERNKKRQRSPNGAARGRENPFRDHPALTGNYWRLRGQREERGEKREDRREKREERREKREERREKREYRREKTPDKRPPEVPK